MKKILSFVVAFTLILTCVTVAGAKETQTPGDFGWYTDGSNNFTGWSATDSSNYSVTASATNSRMWKPLLSADQENFTVSLTIQGDKESYPCIIILGNTIELDSRHGNGNEVYVKLNNNNVKNADGGDWLNATDRNISLVFTRESGGDVSVTMTGKNNSKSVTFNMAKKQDNENIELKANGKATTFSNFTCVCGEQSTKTPGDFGWNTDAGTDFTGWTATNAGKLTVVKNDTKSDTERLIQSLITDKDNFTLRVSVKANNNSSEAVIRLLGCDVKLNSRDGSGQQFYVNELQNWVNAANGEIDVKVSRKDGGNLKVYLLGKGNTEVSYELTVQDETHPEVELKANAGTCSFYNISAGDVETVSNPGDLGWRTDAGQVFTGWTANDAGELVGTKSETAGNTERLIKELIEDKDNFEFKITVTANNNSTEGIIRLLGCDIKLNSRDGSGHQFYSEKLQDWVEADDGVCYVTISRKDGGQLNVSLQGKGQTAKTFSMNAGDESHPEVELKVTAGVVMYSEISTKTPSKTPGDFGWNTDDSDFTGWEATDDSNITTKKSEYVKNRIWKSLINDVNNFKVSITVTGGVETANYIKVLDQTVELDTRGSASGDEFYLKLNGTTCNNDNWFDAKDNIATVTFNRFNGGDLSITFNGNENTTPCVVTVKATDLAGKTGTNVEIGNYEGFGKYKNITVAAPDDPTVEPLNPGDFDWENEENNFTGWEAIDENTFSAVKNFVTENRIWKSILTDKNNFTFKVNIKPGVESAAYLKIFGREIELDTRHSNDGNEAYYKIDGTGKSWIDGTDNEIQVKVIRKDGGDILVEFTGVGNDTPVYTTLTALEEKETVELGIYEGTASYSKINYNKTAEKIDVAKDLGDYGWSNESDNFTGWTVVDANNFSAIKSKVSENRVWKTFFTDKNNFTFYVTITPDVESAAYFKVFGHEIELDTRHSNDGNEVFYKIDSTNYTWIDASNNEIQVMITRKNGGTIKVELTGKDNAASKVFEIDVREEKDNVEFGIYEGKASYTKISTSEKGKELVVIKTFSDYGWHNDNDDFTGWTLIDEANFSVDYSKMKNHRVWKSLYGGDMNNFCVKSDVTVGDNSEAVVRVFGIDIQLDSRHNDGKDQVGVKLDGAWYDWVQTEKHVLHTYLTRKDGGDIKFTVVGKEEGIGISFEFTPIEDNENYELSINEGTASYTNIIGGAYEDAPEVKRGESQTDDPGNKDNPKDEPGKDDKPQDEPVKIDSKGWDIFGADFTGWEITDEHTLSVDSNIANINRVTKELIEDVNNFAVRVVIHPEDLSTGYVSLMGQKVSVSACGDGTYEVTLPDKAASKFDSSNGSFNVTFTRTEGGKLLVSVTGLDNSKVLSGEYQVSDTGSKVEIGASKGKVSFTSVDGAKSIAKLSKLADADPEGKEISESSSNTLIIILAIAGGVIIIGAAVLFLILKKKKTNK